MEIIRPMSETYAICLRDESRTQGHAESISFPKSGEEVRAVLREMHARGIPVTVQGGRTGVTGAAVPQGGHILNLSRMDRILGLARTDGGWQLRTEPGVMLLDLRAALRSRVMDTRGWDAASLQALETFRKDREYFFPTDPTEPSACLGGMAACNASGARTYRYGAMRRHVAGLQVVLADGRLLKLTRGACRAAGKNLTLQPEEGPAVRLTLPEYRMPKTKNASGYYIEENMDAVDLFVGSDGTLGVITELTLDLLPLPGKIWGVSCFFRSEAEAIAFTEAVRRTEPSAAAIEYFDEGALAILRRQKEKNISFSELPVLPEAAVCCVYAEFHVETEREAAGMLERIRETLEAAGGSARETWLAWDAPSQARLQFFRHAVPESVNQLIDARRKTEPSITKLAGDMSVPDEYLAQVMALYREGLAREGLESATWGHIGNNHLHVNILPRDRADYEKGKALIAEWARAVTGMGGAVSAEHGIGKLKRSYLEIMVGEEGLAGFAGIKTALDPHWLLGRGNLFPDSMQPWR